MELGVELSACDTDKSSGYMANYEREVGHLRSERITILELGVQRGGSLLLWRDLFPEALIAGLDLNLVQIQDDTGRIRVFQGYQQDEKTLEAMARDIAPNGFGVIIDDASHLGGYTAASFRCLFPRHLKPGGVYVMYSKTGLVVIVLAGRTAVSTTEATQQSAMARPPSTQLVPWSACAVGHGSAHDRSQSDSTGTRGSRLS